jgi:hypothetical protein
MRPPPWLCPSRALIEAKTSLDDALVGSENPERNWFSGTQCRPFRAPCLNGPIPRATAVRSRSRPPPWALHVSALRALRHTHGAKIVPAVTRQTKSCMLELKHVAGEGMGRLPDLRAHTTPSSFAAARDFGNLGFETRPDATSVPLLASQVEGKGA